MNKPLVTIAVLNRNGSERLRNALPSWISQDFNKEILILDNASTDDSLAFISSFAGIRVIKGKTNKGYGAAKNQLVRESGGEYVLLLDNDIELVGNDFLFSILREHDRSENIAFISPLVRDVDRDTIDSLGLYYNMIQARMPLEKCLGLGTFRVPGYMGNAVFFRKDVFVSLGGFDEIYPFNIDDYDLSARAYLMGYCNYLTSRCLVVHHGIDTRSNIDSLSWKNRYYLSGFSRMILKNYKRANVLIWLPISALWIFVKTIKNSVRHHSPRHMLTYCVSAMILVRDLPSTLRERSAVQGKRTVCEDVFLKIKYLRSHGR